MSSLNFRFATTVAGLLLVFIGSVVWAQNKADPVVIELGKNSVSRSEFDKLFNVAIRMLAAQQGIAFTGTNPEQLSMLRKQFLGQRANEMALLQEADRRNIRVSDADIQTQFDDYKSKLGADAGIDGAVNETVLRRLIKEKQQVLLLSDQLLNEIEVRPGEVVVLHHDMEEQLATPEQSCLRHIVVAELENANRLLAELKNGADFAELARQESIESKSAADGGDLGCFAREHIIPKSDFERAAFNTKVGELTGPVSSEYGYHLLVVYDHKDARTPGLNEVYEELEKEIRHEKLPSKLIELRDTSGVITYPDRLDG